MKNGVKLLEERGNTLLLITDDNRVELRKKDSHTLLRCKYFEGKRISLLMKEGENTGLVEEDAEGKFVCSLNGISLRIDAADVISRVAQDYIESGSMAAFVSAFRFYFILDQLGIRVRYGLHTRPLQLDREGMFYCPRNVEFHFTEFCTYKDGSKVAKAVFHNSGSRDTYGVFRESRTSVALMGLDEAKQHWMHFLPPTYENRTIEECELWLAGGEEGDEIVF